MSRVCANGPKDWGSILDGVIPKTQKWYLILSCLTQHYKVRINDKVKQIREWGSAFPYTSV